jgi:Zn-dependent protease with chaperone function
MDNSVEKRILKIFEELKTRKLIDSDRKIKSKKMPGAFKASVFTSNTISFNPILSTELNDDMIRFCLLHEEGHLKKGQYGVSALFLLWGLGIIPLIYCILSGIGDGIFVISLCFALFVIFSSIRILTEPFHWDEYGSDEFASKILREHYGIKRPSEILKNTLEKLPSSVDLSKFSHRLFYTLVENHPSAERRVKNIIELFDERADLCD